MASVSDQQILDFYPDSVNLMSIDSVDVKIQVEKLKKINQQVHATAYHALNPIAGLKENDQLAVCYTGSDGREEKIGLASPVELFVVISGRNEHSQKLLQRIEEVVAREFKIFDPEVEVKDVDHDNLLMYEGRNRRPFPTRALDAKFLIGSCSAVNNFRKTFFNQLKDVQNNKTLRKFRRKNAKKPLVALSRIKTSNDDESCGLNLKTGVMIYDGTAIVKATKFPILRSYQYSIAVIIFRTIQQEKMSWEDFEKLPRDIPARIQYLCNLKLFDPKSYSIELIQKVYLLGMIWFGESEKNYRVYGKQTMRVDPSLLNEVFQITYDLFAK